MVLTTKAWSSACASPETVTTATGPTPRTTTARRRRAWRRPGPSRPRTAAKPVPDAAARAADEVRRLTGQLDDVPLACDPVVVVRAAAGQCGVEHLLRAEVESTAIGSEPHGRRRRARIRGARRRRGRSGPGRAGSARTRAGRRVRRCPGVGHEGSSGRGGQRRHTLPLHRRGRQPAHVQLIASAPIMNIMSYRATRRPLRLPRTTQERERARAGVPRRASRPR